MTHADSALTLETIYSKSVADALHELFEHKHLYQSVRVNLGVRANLEAAGKAPKELSSNVMERANALQNGPWRIFGSETPNYSGRGLPAGLNARVQLEVKAPDLKLFCKAPCQRVEPFHATQCIDVLSGVEYQPARQILALSYRCQSCKGEPTVLLVRREGLKLTLAGRSPIEQVYVPKVVPRQVADYYSGAVVAHQSGQTLAGNFLLRTLVEQWVRSFPGTADFRVEAGLDWYYRHLPDDFKKRFPSLREIYENLSSDIHAARGDADLFATEAARIVKHFDAWRLFELDHAAFGRPMAEAE